MNSESVLEEQRETIEGRGHVLQTNRMDSKSVASLLRRRTRPTDITDEAFRKAVNDISERSYTRTVVNFSGSLPGAVLPGTVTRARRTLQFIERLFG